MPKKVTKIPMDFEASVMSKVRSQEITMKPRWYFVVGSVLMIVGFSASSMGAVFFINIAFFLLRQHGPMGQWRLQQIISSFPLWILPVALLGIMVGIVILKQYDFSYKKNFWVVAGGFIASIVMAAFMLDYFGFDDVWFRTGPMRRYYQQIDTQTQPIPRGQGNGWRRNIQK